MKPIHLRDVASLGRHHQKLAALGYETTDQLRGTAKAAPEHLAAYLGLDRAGLNDLLASLPDSQTGVTPIAALVARPPFSLGVLLDHIPPVRQAFQIPAPGAVPLPPIVNFVNEMQAIRNQEQRGTCVAHASTAAAEHYWRGQGTVLDLSRQFLYWDCKRTDSAPNLPGTWIGIAMQCLQTDGCCVETTWPYVTVNIPGKEGQDPPPLAAVPEALNYKVPSFLQIAPTSVMDIKSQLAQKKCVAFSIPVFNSWYLNDAVTLTGEIGNPLPDEQAVGGHAMCFVGYEDMPGSTGLGGGVFYLRNSWGSDWATSSSLGVIGYGKIPYSYIDRFGMEAYSIT